MKTLNPHDRALVAVLPRRIRAEIDRWRQVHDPNRDILPPHITVAYPPFVPEEQWPGERLAVRQCLGQFRPFQILLYGLGTFETQHLVLWLRVEDQGWLSTIRAALMHCLPQYMPPLPFRYVPHVTIGVFESRSDMDKVQEAIRADMKPRRFTVRHLTYLCPDQRGVWSVCSRVPLGIGSERSEAR
jgi:2'-5' RNA ligase